MVSSDLAHGFRSRPWVQHLLISKSTIFADRSGSVCSSSFSDARLLLVLRFQLCLGRTRHTWRA